MRNWEFILFSMRTRWAVGAVGIGAAVVWLWHGSARRAGPPSHGALRGANLLLVTIDTLRADRLSAYGGAGTATPTLDRLARGGAVFARAYSHVPVTLPAHASLLTGVLPPRHGVRNNGSYRLGTTPPTLAERLGATGYRTGAFVGAFVLDQRFGLARGFDQYDDRYSEQRSAADFYFAERPAERVLRPAVDWILESAPGGAPWFAWVHVFDPHAPYRAPERYASGRSAYDAEVAYTDDMIGAALDVLRARGSLDRTLIVITADHGESLGEHGETTHGLFAYESTLRVPLILSGPGIPPARITAPIGHVDVVPTVLDLLGVGVGGDLDGRSRREELDGDQRPAAPIYFEALDANLTRGWAPLTGVIAGNWKYIDLPIPELYDLSADGGERSNVANREPRRVRELQAHLRERSSAAVDSRRAVDPSEAARLQSLGYVSGAARQQERYGEEDDPKRLVGLNDEFNRALEEYGEGRRASALDRLLTIVRSRPDFLAARLSGATVLIELGRPAEAVRLLNDADRPDREMSAWLTRMGQALQSAGDLRKARDTLTRATAINQGDPEPLNALAVVQAQLGERDEARRLFRSLLAVDPTATGTWYNLGAIELQLGNLDAAATAFRQVVDLDPHHAGGWQGLGAAQATSSPDAAIEAWQRAVEVAPDEFDTLFNLAMLLADSSRPAAAAPYLERFLREAPSGKYAADFPRVRATLARVRGAR